MTFSYGLNSATIKPTPILKKVEVAAEAGYAGANCGARISMLTVPQARRSGRSVTLNAALS